MGTNKNEPSRGFMMRFAARNNLLMAGAVENPGADPRTTDNPSSLVRPDCESECLDRVSQVHSFDLTTYDTSTDPELAPARAEIGASALWYSLARRRFATDFGTKLGFVRDLEADGGVNRSDHPEVPHRKACTEFYLKWVPTSFLLVSKKCARAARIPNKRAGP
jgi:hypothetical protein